MKKKIYCLLIFSLFCSLAFAQVTNDPHLTKQWWIKSPEVNGGVNLQRAWEISKHNYTPVIAVIDDGFHLEHEDLNGRVLVNKNEIPDNNIDDDNNGFIDDYFGYAHPFCKGLSLEMIEIVERSGISCKPSLKPISSYGNHGNHVAGIIAANQNNGKGIAGVTKYSKLVPIKNDAYGWDRNSRKSRWQTIESLATSISYAILRGADVINISQNHGKESEETPELSEAYAKLNQVVAKAAVKNIIIVVAAGNDSLKNDSGYFGEMGKIYKNIIVVGNSSLNGSRTPFSNYGDEVVHIFAPGIRIYSLGVSGEEFFSNEYLYLSGTSMAAPIVSGIIGLILSTHGPQASRNIRERLINSSYKHDNLNGYSKSAGVIDAYRAIRYSL